MDNNVCDLLAQIRDLLSKSNAINQQLPLTNPVVVPSTGTGVLVIASNTKRKGFRIVNLSAVVVNVYLDTPGGTFVPLSACGVAGDGTGGVLSDALWTGNVYVLAASGTGNVEVTEFI